ncbi:DNA-binding protein D-ETS-4-like [Pollicipes pollicipes]|uniref:DNA-binding protein D-ETS-4-like n=1 Tax=Pollicipes pollicipes TaxID=41117 RepID=UPI0018852749|nr:DNA-binding protein D-ETS-4-like [Pollicipes pollicipes]
MMSQMVPSYAAGGADLASSLAELDFSILSDYEVPSPGSLAPCERSPPHLFGSPPHDAVADADWEWPAAGGAPSPPAFVKRELPAAEGCRSLHELAAEVGATPRSPLSDAGYASQGGSPSGCRPASPPPEDHQLLRQCLRDTSLQRRLNMPAFSLDMLYAEAGPQHTSSWMMEQLEPVFDLALEQIRQEKKSVCGILGISPDPTEWSVEDVRAWAAYMCQQFGLTPSQTDWLNMDGQALCCLREHQFLLCDPQGGATLFAKLEAWRSTCARPAAAPANWTVKTEPAELSPPPSAAPAADDMDTDDEEDQVTAARSGSHIHLWQFLKELLTHPQLYGSSIRWVDRQAGIFKIEDSVRVAKLWGKRKNRPAMNYDKLSRSIRQYYKKGIMKKTERSQRLVYQFCHPYSL